MVVVPARAQGHCRQLGHPSARPFSVAKVVGTGSGQAGLPPSAGQITAAESGPKFGVTLTISPFASSVTSRPARTSTIFPEASRSFQLTPTTTEVSEAAS